MLPYIYAAILVWTLDRFSKYVVRKHTPSFVFGFFRIQPECNRASYSRARLSSSIVLWILAGAASLILIGIPDGSFQFAWMQITLGAAIGGGAGNLYDLWRYGAIQDFLSVNLGVFNLADVAIVCGIAMTILSFLIHSFP